MKKFFKKGMDGRDVAIIIILGLVFFIFLIIVIKKIMVGGSFL